MPLLLDAGGPCPLVEADRSRVLREQPAATPVCGRVRLPGARRPGVLPSENAIVHLPELVLVSGARRLERRQSRLPAMIERDIVGSEAALPGVGEALPNVRLGEGRELRAGGALEIS